VYLIGPSVWRLSIDYFWTVKIYIYIIWTVNYIILIIYTISAFNICQIKIFYLRLITIRHVILVKDAWVLLSTCRYILEYALDVYVHENISNLIYTGMNFRCTCSWEFNSFEVQLVSKHLKDPDSMLESQKLIVLGE
jgi:hypothetical protein